MLVKALVLRKRTYDLRHTYAGAVKYIGIPISAISTAICMITDNFAAIRGQLQLTVIDHRGTLRTGTGIPRLTPPP